MTQDFMETDTVPFPSFPRGAAYAPPPPRQPMARAQLPCVEDQPAFPALTLSQLPHTPDVTGRPDSTLFVPGASHLDFILAGEWGWEEGEFARSCHPHPTLLCWDPMSQGRLLWFR